MKISRIYKITILTFFFIINFSNFSIASCDFKIKIGQNISKIKKFIDFNSTENSEQSKKELNDYSTSSKNIIGFIELCFINVCIILPYLDPS